ncbi:LVIVD repeat-containing protein [Ulvibacter antarcticus]|uniref:LVIVD repeat-containing protein n=1 Tax=Ulvibacter antarcticus TaxID=442714 RepID=A0A3L9YK64_9FLAO|nr:hypothetical protein [Ulvibacter antarcticus]RMA58505.1 LVIVD repeat-containing protein [Ulvibacter antarcticus]
MKSSSLYILCFFLLLQSCSNNDNGSADDNPDPENIEFTTLWENATTPQLPQAMIYDVANRPYFYVVMKSGGVAIYSADNPVPITSVSTANFDNLHAMNITQQGNYLFVSLGDFFGGNAKAGMAIIDVSNPETPQITDYWSTSTEVKGSAVVKVEGDFAYLGAMNQGVFILDVSNKSAITEISQYIPDVDFPMPNPTSIQEPNARGMAIVNELLYLCYDAGGLRIIDVSDKVNPIEIGRYINEGINKQQAFNNIIINCSVAYITTDFCGVEIVDISDPTHPIQLDWVNPWACETNANTWFNSDGHTNQIAYDAASQLIFLSSGGSEMVVMDVANPANAFLVSTYGDRHNNQGAWGIELHNDKIYLLYITAIVPFPSNFAGIRCIQWEEM